MNSERKQHIKKVWRSGRKGQKKKVNDDKVV
jgi:hypothetical protein